MTIEPPDFYGLSICSARTLKAAIRNAVQSNAEDSRLSRTTQYIYELELILEARPQTCVTLDDLAHILDLEKTYCCKLFRKTTGMSFSEWIRRIRIKKAKKLLRHSRHSVTAISHACGYQDITTFERNFRKQVGETPTTYRKSSRADR